MVRRLTAEEEMVIAGVGQEEALYNRGLEDHDVPAWRLAAFARVAVGVTANVRRMTGDDQYQIDGPRVDIVYRRLRRQYNTAQLKMHNNQWVRENLNAYNDGIVSGFWYLRRHQHHVDGFKNQA